MNSKISYLRIIFRVLVICLISKDAVAQCPQENVLIYDSQLAVDQFRELYPDCKKVGSIEVRSSDISNLNGFSNLDMITTLSIKDTRLKNLDSIKVRVQSLSAFHNMELEDISTILIEENEGVLTLYDNPKLHNINISNVRSLGSISFLMDSLDVLFGDIEEIQALQLIGDISFNSNSGGKIKCFQHAYFSGCSRYKSFEDIFNDIEIVSSNILSFSIGGVDSFSAKGYVEDMVYSGFGMGPMVLTDIHEFAGKSAAMRFFNVLGVSGLEDMEVFGKFKAQWLYLDSLDDLTSLSGLESIVDTLRSIQVKNNDNLMDISVLEGLNEGLSNYDRLIIQNNAMLAECQYLPICDRLQREADNPVVIVEGNNGNCVDEPTLLEACISSSPAVSFGSIDVYPNPVHDMLYLENPVVIWGIYDSMGGIVYGTSYMQIDHVDVSSFPCGLYSMIVTDGFKVTQLKFIKY